MPDAGSSQARQPKIKSGVRTSSACLSCRRRRTKVSIDSPQALPRPHNKIGKMNPEPQIACSDALTSAPERDLHVSRAPATGPSAYTTSKAIRDAKMWRGAREKTCSSTAES